MWNSLYLQPLIPCGSVSPLFSPGSEKKQGKRMHLFTCCSEIFAFEGRRRMLLFGFTNSINPWLV